MTKVAGRSIRQVAIIDDDADVRASYSESVVDLGMKPIDLPGPLPAIDVLLDGPLKNCDAVITDLVLKRTGYANYDGSVVASACYKRRIPAVICTSYYSDASRQISRRDRRMIPSIIPMGLQHERFLKGVECAIREIDGDFATERRPWRTQLEVVDVSDGRDYFWVIVMGRSPNEKVAIEFSEAPPAVTQKIAVGKKLHAVVNTGAKTVEDLYFADWENR